MTMLLSLADAKAYLNIAVTTWDTEITAMCNAVTTLFERECARRLVQAAVTDVLDGTGTELLFLTDYAETITSIHVDSNREFAVATLVSADDYTLHLNKQSAGRRVEYLDNFWDLYTMLPKETARFVPRLIATFLIINNPEKYGFNLPSPDPPLRYETIKINRPIRLSSLSKKLGLGSEALASLNPELRYKATPEHEYLLKIPIGSGGKALAAVNSISRWIPPEATYVYHYVRRGETVSGIAKRYRTSVTAIARLNRLSRNYLIRPGQRLKVPGRGRSYVSARPFQLIKDGEKLVYIVRRGDSLYRIANSFSTTVQRIKKENNLRSDNLSIGQKLVIQSGRPEGATLYTVKTGDTPFEIAKKYRMNLNTLLNLNGLHSRSKIYPGQKLWVTPNDSK